MNIITVGDGPFFDRIEFFDLVSLQLAQLSRVFDWLLASSVSGSSGTVHLAMCHRPVGSASTHDLYIDNERGVAQLASVNQQGVCSQTTTWLFCKVLG